MKTSPLLFSLFFVLTACLPQPAEPINVYPTLMPTPTLAVITAPVEGDRIIEAEEFFYHMKLHLAGGEIDHLAEEVRYPITVMVDGERKTFVYAAELSAYLPQILTEENISRLMSADESELDYSSEGVKILDGLIVFNLICFDPACENAQFLITEINN